MLQKAGGEEPTSGKIWAKYSWQKNKVFQAGWVLVQVNQNRVPGITWEMSITLLRMRSLWLKWQCGWCWCKREFETMPMTTAGMENTHVLLTVAWKRKMHAGGQASGGSLAQRKQSLLAITCPIRTTRTMSMLIFYCQCALDVNVYSRVRGWFACEGQRSTPSAPLPCFMRWSLSLFGLETLSREGWLASKP